LRYADIPNVWSVDVTQLSNADRGKVYLDRARCVVRNALSDPGERRKAVEGSRFRRAYLIEQIGCRASVTTQNPGVRTLLNNTDAMLARETATKTVTPRGKGQSRTIMSAEIADLRRLVAMQAAEIAALGSRFPSESTTSRTMESRHG